MRRRRNRTIGATLGMLLLTLAVAKVVLVKKVEAQAKTAVQAPRFEVDPLWPKPMPNHWVIGSTIGLSVDAQNHVWVVHRGSTVTNGEKGAELTPPTTAECCKTAPPVLEFDAAGNLLRHWGGPGQGYDWPQSMHGVYIDYKNNLWLGGNGAKDSQISKWTQDGKFLMQIGKFEQTKGSSDTANVHSVAQVTVDKAANEIYVADGYGNHRIIVYDADSGAYKRMWGAYGNKPEDTDFGRYNPTAPPLQQFRNPVHCVAISVDNFVYVCDRVNDRIQVFTKDGKFVKETFVAKNTLGSGSVWEIAFSKDAAQKYMYLSDGANERIYIIDRPSMEILTSFGDGGRQPGQFYGVHSIATDSAGNIYTTETFEGKRLQKFVYKGLANVSKMDQGTVWPAR